MKNLKTNWLFKHTLTVFSCVLIVVLGIVFLSHADPVTTTIGENIATNDLSVAGNVTSGTWQGTAVATQFGGTGADWSAVAQGNLPYFSAEGALSNLAPGTAGQFLQSGGTGADPAWANVTRSATFVVAANDSSALSKQQADCVCDGTDDQVEIQAAIDALPSGGGKVVLMEGTYTLSSKLIGKQNMHLQGMGKNNTIIQPASGYSDDVLIDSEYKCEISQLQFNGRYLSDSIITGGIYFHPSVTLDLRFTIRDCFFVDLRKSSITGMTVDEFFITNNSFMSNYGYEAISGQGSGDVVSNGCSYMHFAHNGMANYSNNILFNGFNN